MDDKEDSSLIWSIHFIQLKAIKFWGDNFIQDHLKVDNRKISHINVTDFHKDYQNMIFAPVGL